jgi:hypothetical protein
MKVPLLLCALWLATAMACLAPKLRADFEADLKGWIGKPMAEFILYKGEPEQTRFRPQGGRILTFLTHQNQSGSRETSRFANADGTMGRGVRLSSPLYCRLILDVDDKGTILTTRWEGNDCW